MDGKGPAPKDPEQRRTRHVPQRGDWVEIRPREGRPPKLPAGDWHPRAAQSWVSWWKDPAASQWSEAQQAELVELLALADEFWRGSTVRAPEMRQRCDGLGLTLKGKRDLRWRVAPEEFEVPAVPVSAAERRARLKVV